MWILLVVAVMVALVVSLALRFIAERGQAAEFLDDSRQLASGFNEMGVRADTLLAGLETADRSSVVAVMDETTEEATARATEWATREIPPAVAEPAGYLRVAVSSWTAGLVQMEAGLLAALVDPASVEAAAALREAFLNFRVGDRAYAGFVRVAEALEENNGRTYPPVQFVPPELEGRFDATTVLQRIAALEDLGPVTDVAVADVRFDPAPSGDRDGQMVIPFSPTLLVEATVTNRGNEPVTNLTATMLLLGVDTGDLIADERRMIGRLDPKQSATITFADLPVEPGSFYEVVIAAPLEADVEPESNEVRQVFYRNEPE